MFRDLIHVNLSTDSPGWKAPPPHQQPTPSPSNSRAIKSPADLPKSETRSHHSAPPAGTWELGDVVNVLEDRNRTLAKYLAHPHVNSITGTVIGLPTTERCKRSRL